TNGSYPQSLLQANDGNFYGTSLFGGTNGDGVVFKLSTNGVLSALHAAYIATGNYPEWPIQAQDGDLYGTADNGPYQGGVVWKMTLNGDYSVIHAFDRTTGYSPGTGLVQDGDGMLYGTFVGV